MMTRSLRYLIERIVNIDDVLIAYPPAKVFRDEEGDGKSYHLEMPPYADFINLDTHTQISVGALIIYNVKERDQRFAFCVTQPESGKDAVFRAKLLGGDTSPEEVRAERALQLVPLHPK